MYDWDLRNKAKKSPEMIKDCHFGLFSIFAKTVHTILDEIFAKTVHTILEEIFYSHSTPYYGPMYAISSNSYDWDSSQK